jgi:4-(gamma-glutamylamino)butanal dehydrogenase
VTKPNKYRDLAGSIPILRNAYIDGESVPALSGATFENLNPATATPLGPVAACDKADVDRAVAAARRAFNDGVWSRAAPEFRKGVLLKLEAMERHLQTKTIWINVRA